MRRKITDSKSQGIKLPRLSMTWQRQQKQRQVDIKEVIGVLILGRWQGQIHASRQIWCLIHSGISRSFQKCVSVPPLFKVIDGSW